MKRKLVLIISISSFLLVGCTNIISLTDTESDMVAQYMASMLLKREKNYEEKLVYEEQPTKEQQEISDLDLEIEEQLDNTEGVGQKQQKENRQYVSLEEIYKVPNFNISYKRYGLYYTYPEQKDPISSGMDLGEPKNGKQFLVLELSIQNTAQQSSQISLLNGNITYQLDINVGTTYNPLLTILPNDIQCINETIDAGGIKTNVLVFEVEKDIKIDKMNLFITNKDKTAVIKIK